MVRAAVGGAQLIVELWDDVRRGRAGLMRLGGTALLAGLAFCLRDWRGQLGWHGRRNWHRRDCLTGCWQAG